MNIQDIGKVHIDQFDSLIDENILNDLVTSINIDVYRGLTLSYTGIEIEKPYDFNIKNRMDDKRIYPKTSRLERTVYGGKCFLKMAFSYNGSPIFEGYKDAGIFPVMVRSKLCNTSEVEDIRTVGEDPKEVGGYFIVNGYDRILRYQTILKRNTAFLLPVARYMKKVALPYRIVIRSVGVSEIGKRNEISCYVDGNIMFRIYMDKRAYSIPLCFILKALKNTTDKEILEDFGNDPRILQLLVRTNQLKVFSQKELLRFFGRRIGVRSTRMEDFEIGEVIIRENILPHIRDFDEKYNFLVYAIRKLFAGLDGKIEPDNQDLPSNLEVLTESQLIPACIAGKLEDIKRSLRNKIINMKNKNIIFADEEVNTASNNTSETVDYYCENEDIPRIKKLFESLDFNIGERLTSFIGTGVLKIASSTDLLDTYGYTIPGERINYWRFVSHLQLVSRGAFFSKTNVSSMRKLKPEGWGFLCPIHTPDGEPCGILLHMAQGCRISRVETRFEKNMVYSYGAIPIPVASPDVGVPVFVDGVLCGRTEMGEAFTNNLRILRSRYGICIEIVWKKGVGVYEEILIYTARGRFVRRVRNSKSGTLDWIGASEQEYLNIGLGAYRTKDCFNEFDRAWAYSIDRFCKEAGDNKYLSADLYPYQEAEIEEIFSSVGSTVPYAEYNPSPRNIYQCQMAKQAMGIASYNRNNRADMKTYSINYLQHPIVKTHGYSTFNDFPIGYNCVVAVISYTAYDMEDAVVMSRGSRERGLFSGYMYKMNEYEVPKGAILEYIPNIGERICYRDLIVQYRMSGEDESRIIYNKVEEEGYLDMVNVLERKEGIYIYVMMRIVRMPNIGDKFCSRHGQKGVLSSLWSDVDMPFTESGIRPDIIINPHAFPSRMTMGMFIESMAGKVAAMSGKLMDGTPFRKKTFFDIEENQSGTTNDASRSSVESGRNNIDGGGNMDDEKYNIGEELRKIGMNYYGNEIMYSGITGTPMKTDVFIGNVYYQRLRHMVNDKFQVRTSGKVIATTRQPVGGRKNKGGVRFGEMERDALIGHGSSYLLRDRLADCSDRTDFLWCSGCKSILFTDTKECVCGGKEYRKVSVPYVFKYLLAELSCLNIKIELNR